MYILMFCTDVDTSQGYLIHHHSDVELTTDGNSSLRGSLVCRVNLLVKIQVYT